MTRATLAALLALFVLALASPVVVVVQLASRVEPPARVSTVSAPVVEEETTTTTSTTSTTTTVATRYTKAQRAELFAANTGRCGGDLPPCWVMMRESGGLVTAWNADGCHEEPHESIDGLEHWGCGGKWQFSFSTWNRHGGYETANLAPEHVQDEKARSTWNNGRGCSHWAAC